MTAPYRGVSPSEDDASEAREVEDFARTMHAGRRVWTNADLGHAIIALAMGAACVTVGASSWWMRRKLDGLFTFAPIGLVYLAIAGGHLRRWRISRNSPPRRPTGLSP